MAKKASKQKEVKDDFPILSLDGGGSLGFYTLGFLSQVEQLLGMPLCEKFKLIYGTSTGAIIAALLAGGRSVDDVFAIYKKYIPAIMGKTSVKSRTTGLKQCASEVFKDMDYSTLKTNVGIVAVRCDSNRPLIFKNNIDFAFGGKGTFKPGFDVPLADAVIGSCSAHPFFEKHRVCLKSEGATEEIDIIDGGFVANDPSLFAIVDAVCARKIPREQVKVLSVSTGDFVSPNAGVIGALKDKVAKDMLEFDRNLMDIVMKANANNLSFLRSVSFPEVDCVRVHEVNNDRDLTTHFLEKNLEKLLKIRKAGYARFTSFEVEIKELLGVT